MKKFDSLFDNLIEEFDKISTNNEYAEIFALAESLIKIYNAIVMYYKPDNIDTKKLIDDGIIKPIEDDWAAYSIYAGLRPKTVGEMFFVVCDEQQNGIGYESNEDVDEAYCCIWEDLTNFWIEYNGAFNNKHKKLVHKVKATFEALIRGAAYSDIFDELKNNENREIVALKNIIDNLDSIIKIYQDDIDEAMKEDVDK